MSEMRFIAGLPSQKPMVTQEEYDKARAVLDALPPGIYIKCSSCSKWKKNGEFTVKPPNIVLCERCA